MADGEARGTGDVDDVKLRSPEVDASAAIPSPERRHTVFVAHESDPYDLRRVGVHDSWEVFIDHVKARLKLRHVHMVTDLISGAVIDDVYELRDGDRLEIAGFKLPEEELDPKYFGEDGLYGYGVPGGEFRSYNKARQLADDGEERQYHAPDEITAEPEESVFGTGIAQLDSPSKASARSAGAGSAARPATGASRATAASGAGDALAVAPAGGGAGAAAAGAGGGGDGSGALVAADGDGDEAATATAADDKLKAITAKARAAAADPDDLSDLPPLPEGHPFLKLRGSPAMMRAFRKRGKARPPDSLIVIRNKRYQTLREQGLDVTVADIGDIIAAMLVKPEDKNVQMEGCQALRDALVRPATGEDFDSDSVANSVAEQGAIALVCKTLHRHMENMGVVEQALGVLYQLASVHERDRFAIINEGAISITMAALREHDTHVGIQEQGLQLLGVVSRSLADARSVREQGGETVARLALEAFSSRDGVFEGGNMLIRNCKRLDVPSTADLRPYYER